EGGTFVERISRPGRSNLYRLQEEPLGAHASGEEQPSTPERQDRGGACRKGPKEEKHESEASRQ
ncbi:MAG: hypothetical protein ACR2GR_08345, partial [Rhodothermales bacterium]